MSSRSLSGVPNWWRAAELVSYFPVKGSLGGTCLCLAVLLKSAYVYTRTYTLLCVSSRYVRQGHGGGCDNFPWTCLQGRCYVIHGGVCVSGVDDNVSGTCTQWFFDSTFLWLHYSFALYFFYSTILLLSFDSTILWLYYFLYNSIFIWLCYPFALLFFDSTVFLLYYPFTLRFFDSTFLLLYNSCTLRWRLHIGRFSTKLPLFILNRCRYY